MTHNDLASMKQAVRNVDLTSRPQSSGMNVGKQEREASLLGGAILLGLGVARARHASGWAMIATGGGLLYRGLTGQCGIYKKLGIDTSK